MDQWTMICWNILGNERFFATRAIIREIESGNIEKDIEVVGRCLTE